LFRELLDANLVDTIEVAVIPAILGEGISIISGDRPSSALTLISSKTP
jgi:riboflavin biosynthesis pyrimidine reductase